MSTAVKTTTKSKAEVPRPISTDFVLKKRSKKVKKKKSKKNITNRNQKYPESPVSWDDEDQVTPIDSTPTKSRITTPAKQFSTKKRKSLELNAKIKANSERKLSKPSPTKKKKRKNLKKASSLIRTSPRIAAQATTPCNPARVKTPSQRRRKGRTNSSMVYKFVEYEEETHSTEDIAVEYHSCSETSESDTNVSPIGPIENNTKLAKIKTKTPTKSKSPRRNKIKRKKSRKALSRARASSVGGPREGAHGADIDDDIDNALLKRLKSENKELRKSRNEYRKNHDLLKKIESKLRHKLDIILSKFKMMTIDLLEDDGVDWNKLSKNRDIEGILDAVLTKFSKITDRFVENENEWKQQRLIVDTLKSNWREFCREYIVCNAQCDRDEVEEDFQGMFNVLAEQWMEIETANETKLRLVTNLQTKEKSQQIEIDELEEELLRVRQNEAELNSEKHALEEYKAEYLQIQKKFDEQSEAFGEYKTKSEQEISELTAEKQRVDGQLEESEANLKVIAEWGKDMQKENEDLKLKMEEMRKEFEDKMLAKDKELETIQSENRTLNERKEELLGLQEEHLTVTQKLDEVQGQIDGLQDEFRVIYKKKKKFEAENQSLKEELAETLKKLEQHQTFKNKYDEMMSNRRECGVQTEFAGYNLKDDMLKELEMENTNLMKELNFLIAERSRFQDCTSDNDYHCGDIKSIVVCPSSYRVISGGKDDGSLRIWQVNKTASNDLDEISFTPKQKSVMDGVILTVNMSHDGMLLAAAGSLKNTVNGYVVVWNMKDNGNVLCNLRSRLMHRFGKVHSVEFMKFNDKSKRKSKRMNANVNYLLFAGDTTGCILCWNLSTERTRETPVAVINGHSDIIYDLCIVNKKWLFSVSHDECLNYLNIDNLRKSINNDCDDTKDNTHYFYSEKLFKDDSKYPLKSVVYNAMSNELVFGSRKCKMFRLNNDNESEKKKKYFVGKCALNTKDLDHISKLKVNDNLLIVQRNTTNFVKLFNLNLNKLVKTYQIDDGLKSNGSQRKYKIYDCGITFDQKYAILCVGIFTKQNANNLHLNRSALKGFKIPKHNKNSCSASQ